MNAQNEISSTLFISIRTFLLLQIKTPIFSDCLFMACLKSSENFSKMWLLVRQLFNFQFTTYFNHFQLGYQDKLAVPHLISSCYCPCGQQKQHYYWLQQWSQRLITLWGLGMDNGTPFSKPTWVHKTTSNVHTLYAALQLIITNNTTMGPRQTV